MTNPELQGSFVSTFFVGLIAGVLIATTSFSFVVRNSRVHQGVQTLKLGHSLDVQHPVHQAMVMMRQLVDEKSGGTLRIEIFPNGQLGSETESLEQVQNGALAITKTSVAPLESFIPEMAVFGIPYIFRDDDHFYRVIDGALGQELLQLGQSIGLQGLCFYDAGARSFYTVDRPVLHPDDLAGLKIRVQKSRTAVELIDTLGGLATPIAFGELYTALQAGMVDGAENNPPSFQTSRHCEVCKEYSLDEHARVPDVLMMSRQVWETLTPQHQEWLGEAAEESAQYQRTLWKQAEAEALAQVEAEGVTIHRPDKTPFIARVKSMHDALLETPIGDLIKRIRDEE